MLDQHKWSVAEAETWRKVASALSFLRGKELGDAMKDLKTILSGSKDDVQLERRRVQTLAIYKIVEVESWSDVLACIAGHLKEIRGLRPGCGSA